MRTTNTGHRPRRRAAPRRAGQRAAKGLWVVANVYLDTDKYDCLVTCAAAFRSREAAKKEARAKAMQLFELCNEDRRCRGLPELAFEDAWTEVDRSDGIESEYGFDPVDFEVSYKAIRVFHAEEAP